MKGECNMFSKTDILEKLRNGVSTDAIAESMADELNDAIDTYNAELEAQAKASQEQDEALASVCDAVADYFVKVFGMAPDRVELLRGDEAREALRETFEDFRSAMDPLLNMLGAVGIPEAKNENEPVKKTKQSNSDSIFKSFFKMNNW